MTHDTVFVTLRLTESPKTLHLWPFSFELDVTAEIVVDPSKTPVLRMQLAVKNNSSSEFSFTGALHSYFCVPHVNSIAVSPLHQHVFYDKVVQFERTQVEPLVTISGETDRIYYKCALIGIIFVDFFALFPQTRADHRFILFSMPSAIQISNTEDKSHPVIVLESNNFKGT
jgi:D-hexose-6-phosphate mutarotase